MTFPFPVIISPPKQCNSFYCLGHFKNVYDDDDDDEQPRLLTVLDRLEKLVDAVAPGELGRVSDGAGADEPEEHAERVDVDAAVVLCRQQFRRHVQRRAHHAAGHHRRRLAETEVRQLAAVVKVQLSTTTTNNDCYRHRCDLLLEDIQYFDSRFLQNSDCLLYTSPSPRD